MTSISLCYRFKLIIIKLIKLIKKEKIIEFLICDIKYM